MADTKQTKFILITGGVLSGIGKGVIASSTGRILKQCGFNVTCIKIDPYLNVDAGLMSPFEHGEVYVLDDGGEADLDLGNYERFVDVNLTRDHNITTGKIYSKVIEKVCLCSFFAVHFECFLFIFILGSFDGRNVLVII